MKSFLFGVLAVLLAGGSGKQNEAHAAPVQALKFEKPGVSQTITLKDLKKRLTVHTLTVADPVYHAEKTYEGFLLSDVLKYAGMDATQGEELSFRCKDGYSPTLPIAKVDTRKGLLAFAEKGRKGSWQKFKHGKSLITPAPFYVVWESRPEMEKAKDAYPWPYQLVGIELIRFSQKYDRLFPPALPRDSAAFRGFQTFKAECLKCHSLNLQGGELGPELNIPKNITEYRDDAFLTRFIRNPGEFRARNKMPAFPQLSNMQLAEVIEYFRFMKAHKNPAQ